MITVKRLRAWLASFSDLDLIGIDEGGLTLEAYGLGDTQLGSVEVGGVPYDVGPDDWGDDWGDEIA